MSKEVTTEILRAGPGVSVSGAMVFGVPVETWAIVLTVIYTLLSLFALIRDKYWNHYRKKEDEHPSE